MLFKINNESAAEYLSGLELKTSLTQQHNAFSRFDNRGRFQIVQIRMNNLLPKINAVMTSGGSFSEIVALPDIFIGLWLRNADAEQEEQEIFKEFMEEATANNTEEKTSDKKYYENIIKEPDPEENTVGTEPPELISQELTPESQKQSSNNGIDTKFLYIRATNFVITFKSPDPEKPMDFINIKEEFIRKLNEILKNFILDHIRYHLPDIEENTSFIKIETKEVFEHDEPMGEPEFPPSDSSLLTL